MKLSCLQQRILTAGLEDWIGLWVAVRILRESEPESASTDLLDAIRGLLDARLLIVGAPRVGVGFIPWDLTTTEAIARIETEWQELGRDPTLGEIGWLATTEAGDRIVRETLGKRGREEH